MNKHLSIIKYYEISLKKRTTKKIIIIEGWYHTQEKLQVFIRSFLEIKSTNVDYFVSFQASEIQFAIYAILLTKLKSINCI